MAVKVRLSPVHRLADGGTTLTVGVGFTVTNTFMLVTQAPIVPVTVYKVVTVGEAVTVAPVVALKPDAGLQLYVVAPLAVSTTLPPVHIDGLDGVTVSGGGWVKVTLAVAVHPLASVTVAV